MCGTQPARRSKERKKKSAIMSAAPELSHRLMSGRAPPRWGVGRGIVKAARPWARTSLSEPRGGTKEDPRLSCHYLKFKKKKQGRGEDEEGGEKMCAL